LSQAVLADAIGLTFQQVQKYERGTNRISASALFEIARFLGVEVDYFFLGLPDIDAGDGAVAEAQAGAFLRSAEGVMLAVAFGKLSAAERKVVLATVKGLAGLSGGK
jgi:transcriptional regulator with XRE-family HTH domain